MGTMGRRHVWNNFILPATVILKICSTFILVNSVYCKFGILDNYEEQNHVYSKFT